MAELCEPLLCRADGHPWKLLTEVEYEPNTARSYVEVINHKCQRCSLIRARCFVDRTTDRSFLAYCYREMDKRAKFAVGEERPTMRTILHYEQRQLAVAASRSATRAVARQARAKRPQRLAA